MDKLVLFLAFFLPGFISLQVYGLFIATGERDFAKQLPEVIAFSAIHYALTGWIIFIQTDQQARTIAAYFVVLVLPIFWPPILLLSRNWKKYSKRIFSIRFPQYLLQPEAKPWDRIFDDITEKWVRIRLKSGVWVGGVLARGSSTSTHPLPEQIYIREAWMLDSMGAFIEKTARTGGLLVNGAEIEYIEFILEK
jgi:hypothetical protein